MDWRSSSFALPASMPPAAVASRHFTAPPAMSLSSRAQSVSPGHGARAHRGLTEIAKRRLFAEPGLQPLDGAAAGTARSGGLVRVTRGVAQPLQRLRGLLDTDGVRADANVQLAFSHGAGLRF